MNENALGVYCKKDKNFYYLETGKNHVPRTVSRIARILMARDLIVLSDKDPHMHSQYEVHKIKLAKEKDWNLIPIFFNEHVKKSFEADEDTANDTRWK